MWLENSMVRMEPGDYDEVMAPWADLETFTVVSYGSPARPALFTPHTARSDPANED
jgi:hypothetical protein